MDTDRLRIFVSSRMEELASERFAVKAVLEEMGHEAWGFEAAGARSDSIEVTFTEELEAADLYLAIVWRDLGRYTLQEYELAVSFGKDRLVYQKRVDGGVERDPTLTQFLARISNVERGLTVSAFDDVRDLRRQVKRDVGRWITRAARGQGRVAASAWSRGPLRSFRDRATDAAYRARDVLYGPDAVYRRTRSAIATRARRYWIDGYLRSNVTAAGWMPLEFRVGANDGDGLVSADRIVDTFRGSAESLLILGEPGSGKTMTLALLLEQLLDESGQLDRPLPIMLRLAKWPGGPLEDWIVAELFEQSAVSHTSAWELLDSGLLHLLLDGLDEVGDQRIEKCDEAIREFLKRRDVGIAVTCRTGQLATTKLRPALRESISLQPLTLYEVLAYVASDPRRSRLTSAFSTSPQLLDLCRLPLFLRLAIDGASAQDEAAGDRTLTADELIDDFIRTACHRATASVKGPWDRIARRLEVLVGVSSRFHRNELRLDHVYSQWPLVESAAHRRRAHRARERMIEREAALFRADRARHQREMAILTGREPIPLAPSSWSAWRLSLQWRRERIRVWAVRNLLDGGQWIAVMESICAVVAALTTCALVGGSARVLGGEVVAEALLHPNVKPFMMLGAVVVSGMPPQRSELYFLAFTWIPFGFLGLVLGAANGIAQNLPIWGTFAVAGTPLVAASVILEAKQMSRRSRADGVESGRHWPVLLLRAFGTSLVVAFWIVVLRGLGAQQPLGRSLLAYGVAGMVIGISMSASWLTRLCVRGSTVRMAGVLPWRVTRFLRAMVSVGLLIPQGEGERTGYRVAHDLVFDRLLQRSRDTSAQGP